MPNFLVSENFTEINTGDVCECPVPCQRKMYETSISYALTSKADTHRYIRAANTDALKEKFVKARETVQVGWRSWKGISKQLNGMAITLSALGGSQGKLQCM